MLLREAGDPLAATEELALPDPLADPAVTQLRWKLLYELQDYARLQPAVHAVANQPERLRAIEAADFLQDFLRFAERTIVAPAAMAACLTAIETACQKDPEARIFWRAAGRRLRRRQRILAAGGRARILSLGLNCLPWHLPGRWGLRRAEDFVALFGPFSLASHKVDGVVRAIASDFTDYAQPEALRIVTTAKGHEMAIRRDRLGGWNHVRGAYWLANDYARLRAFLAAQADRFRAACRDPNTVFMMSNCPVEYPEEPLDFLEPLQDALARHTGTTANRILITNQTAAGRAPARHRIDATVTFAYLPFPSADYVWHDDDDANTEEGFAYEAACARLITGTLARWGLATPLGDA